MKHPFNPLPSSFRTCAQLPAVLLALHLGSAHATLGQTPSPSPQVRNTAAATSAQQRAATATAMQSGLYTLHQRIQDNGTTVWEYANVAGQVFAVQWRGPVLPDLSALLGSYFQGFHQDTAQARAQGRHGSPVSVDRTDLVLRSNGRMRNFFGYAYAPALVPTGVLVADVLQ